MSTGIVFGLVDEVVDAAQSVYSVLSCAEAPGSRVAVTKAETSHVDPSRLPRGALGSQIEVPRTLLLGD